MNVGDYDFGLIRLVIKNSGKIIFAPRNGERHATINLGGRSGILDAHLSQNRANGTRESLGGVRARDLETLASRHGDRAERHIRWFIRRAVRPVRFGWVGHHGMLPVPLPFDEQEFLALGEQDGSSWRVSVEKIAAKFNRSVTRAEAEREGHRAFLLFKRGEVVGALFRVPLSDGRSRYCWLSMRQLRRIAGRYWARYGPFLQPLFLTGDEVVSVIPARSDVDRSSAMGDQIRGSSRSVELEESPSVTRLTPRGSWDTF